MSIAVIGQGFVGGSLTTILSENGFDVYAYDKSGKYAKGALPSCGNLAAGYPDSINELISDNERNGTPDFLSVYFVCVPTPMYKDGSADLSIVEKVLEELSSYPGERIAVIKSTVPPGSIERWNKKYESAGLHIVFNPEFLTEVNAVNDMRNQQRIVLGGQSPYVDIVQNIFQMAFPKVLIIKTDSTTAEMVKYVTNCMLAVKVSFANEVAQICEALDKDGYSIEYNKVIEYAKLDQRLGETHWSVPGPVPVHNGRYARGFGGHCFPKDINALISVARSYGINPAVMQATWEKNLEVRSPEDRDWELQVGRAVSNNKI